VLLNVGKMCCHIGHFFVADNHNFGGIVVAEHSDKAVYESFSIDFHQWLRHRYALLGKS